MEIEHLIGTSGAKIIDVDEYAETNKKLADLKSKRHEIMKKESHEILIVKKTP
jgi:hypothetical protein